jgi:NAD(P)H-hydrate epimerase
MLPALPARPEESHKGSYGKVLIIAGSRGMSGAAALAGAGALRGGAGLVTVAVPKSIQAIVAAIEPSYLTAELPEDDQGRFSKDAVRLAIRMCARSSVAAIGPGWGTSADLDQFGQFLYSTVDRPLVVDADALSGLARAPQGFTTMPPVAPRILTPHAGEFARLIGSDTAAVQADREGLAVDFAARNNVVLVLKGHGTIITDGRRLAVNMTGNAGMATGGTGDVLTGLIAALLAQQMEPFDAAHLAAHLHGLAGDLAAADLGAHSLVASDLPRYLGKAFRQAAGA